MPDFSIIYGQAAIVNIDATAIPSLVGLDTSDITACKIVAKESQGDADADAAYEATLNATELSNIQSSGKATHLIPDTAFGADGLQVDKRYYWLPVCYFAGMTKGIEPKSPVKIKVEADTWRS